MNVRQKTRFSRTCCPAPRPSHVQGRSRTQKGHDCRFLPLTWLAPICMISERERERKHLATGVSPSLGPHTILLRLAHAMFLFPLSFSGLKDEATFVAGGGEERRRRGLWDCCLLPWSPQSISGLVATTHPGIPVRKSPFTSGKNLELLSTMLSFTIHLAIFFFPFNYGDFYTKSLVCRLLLRGGGEERKSLFLSPPPCPPFFGTGRCSRCFSSFLSPHAHSRHSAPPFSSSWIHEKLAPSSPPPLSSDAPSPSLHLLPSPLHLIN